MGELARAEGKALPASADGSCVTVGPFATNELAARARQTLTDSGYPSVPREVKTSTVDGYWVYLESPVGEVGERRLIDRLKRGGIEEARGVGETGMEADLGGGMAARGEHRVVSFRCCAIVLGQRMHPRRRR